MCTAVLTVGTLVRLSTCVLVDVVSKSWLPIGAEVTEGAVELLLSLMY